MKRKHLKTVKDFKGKVVLEELQRAHWMIAILSFGLVLVIVTAMISPLEISTILGVPAVILLAIVGCISGAIAIYLYKK